MSNSEIERFSKDVAANESLRNELKAVGTGKAAIVAFANAKGYNFSVNDVESLAGTHELSDQDLEKVAGGIYWVGSGDNYVCAGGKNVFVNW